MAIASLAFERPGPSDPGWPPAGREIATPLCPMPPPQHRSKTAEPLSPDDLVGRRRRHEIEEREKGAALRHLHPLFDRAWPRAGVQLARQSKGGVGNLHQEPSP